MSDVKTRILDIIGQPQLCGFATITEDGKPWVRYVAAVGGPNMELRFASFIDARKVKQIAANPEVHLTCGVNNLTEMKPYLQIQGRARLTTEADERHAFWNDMLAPIFSGPDDPKYGIIVVQPYRIEYCDPASMGQEVWKCGGDCQCNG
ncbi:MAG TPA: pyridoxamine 5'-phosphate oxidase family protein [Thermoguttaceae bacterium]|nr:pyridoxamine 5'-phosphate oxidase family protein [Thermoguttaceae bacterium]